MEFGSLCSPSRDMYHVPSRPAHQHPDGPEAGHQQTRLLAVVSPVLEDPEAPGRHAVDAPVGDPVLVADPDREPPVVGPHDLDDRPRGTLQVQPVPLAGVGGLHGLPGS